MMEQLRITQVLGGNEILDGTQIHQLQIWIKLRHLLSTCLDEPTQKREAKQYGPRRKRVDGISDKRQFNLRFLVMVGC